MEHLARRGAGLLIMSRANPMGVGHGHREDDVLQAGTLRVETQSKPERYYGSEGEPIRLERVYDRDGPAEAQALARGG